MAAGKRANGEGSVYRRKADGKWIAAVSTGSKRSVAYATSKREAQRKLKELQAGLALTPGSARPICPILSEWAEQWLSMRQHELRPSTLRDYKLSLEMWMPTLGTCLLNELKPLVIASAVTEFRVQGRGNRSIQRAFSVLSTCLRAAVRIGLLQEDPLRHAPKPAWKPRDRQYWSTEQAKLFVGSALMSRRKHAPLFVFLVTTGLRVSEALALTWDDISDKDGIVRIEKALVCVDGSWHLMPPKSVSGRRQVSLPAIAVHALENVPRSRANLFFEACPPERWKLRNCLRAMCKDAKVPYVNVHGLRHVSAMLALEATGDAYAVQRRLGHSHISTTLGIYGYSTRRDSSVSEALDELLT